MAPPTFEIRNLENAHEMASIVTVFQQVWGTVTPIVNVELLCAIAHSGGYVAAVYEHDHVMGASFGFLARHQGRGAPCTATSPGCCRGSSTVGSGGRSSCISAIGPPQRSIAWITWTFDPLVRRNAWFNIGVLGAHVAEYLVDFYGPMTDAINANDESDRLVVAWPTDPDVAPPTPPDGARLTEVPTPGRHRRAAANRPGGGARVAASGPPATRRAARRRRRGHRLHPRRQVPTAPGRPALTPIKET